MPQPAPQTVINDRYLLVKVLGQGGMGTVHLASDLGRDNLPVALKRINPALVTPGIIESFKAEFDAMTRLNHPNVVQVLDFGTDRSTGTHFLTMEYVDGGDLGSAAAAWQAGTSPQPDLGALLDLIVQACRGLDYIHARGLVHNDLKLQNLLLTSNQPQVVKLSDFGLASGKLEQGPGMRGTMHYLAPELVHGAPPDRRTDLYAFGVAIYRMLTGRMPLDGTQSELLLLIATRTPDPPSRFNADIPAALDKLILEMLAKDPARRPASAAQVIASLNDATGRRDSVDTRDTLASYLASARFVGRQAELEKLTRLLEGARSSTSEDSGVLVMLSGESGVGKSRLLRRLQQEAQLRGCSVVMGQCYPDAGSAFHPFIQILHELCSGPPEDPDLGALLSPVDPGDSHEAPDGGRDALRAQRRVVDAAVRVLRRASADQPLLVVIEDLQWADSASISLLEHMARNIAGAGRLMVVTTWRSEEEDTPSLAAPLERLERAGKWHKVELARLRREDVAQMLAGMFGMEEAPPGVIDLLQSETEGNPLYVKLAAESLVETGAVRREGAGWITDETHLEQIVFPRSVADAIGLRLSQLEPEELRLLETLAVCEKPAGDELLASVLRACGDEGAAARMAASIETLTSRRLGARILHDDGVLRLRIDHIRIRDHVYDSMDWERRRRLHHEIGLALESGGVADSEVLAHHFLNSPDSGRALSYAQTAGRHAMRLYAGERAASFLERALDLVPPAQVDQRLRLQLQLADAWRQARESARAIETYERVVRGAKAAGRKQIAYKATADLVDALWRAGRHEEAQRAAERHLMVLRAEGDKANQAMCLTILGNIAGGHGRMAECRRCNEEALELHQEVGDSKGAASNLNNLGLIDLVEGPTEQGRARLEAALSIHKELGDLQRATEVIGNLGSWHRMRGDYDQAARRLEEAAEMARSHRDRWLLAHFEPNLAGTYLARALMDRAMEAARRAVANAIAIGDDTRQCEGLDYQGMIERDMGHAGEAAACHEKAAALARRISDASQEGYAVTSLALDRLWSTGTEPMAEADLKAARDLMRRAGKLIPATGSARLRARLHEASARLALTAAEIEPAELEAGRLLEVSTEGSLPDCSARGHLLLAQARAARGDDAEAAAEATKAAEAAASCGLVETQWQAHAMLAACELKAGRRSAEREQLSRAAATIQSAAARIQDEQVRLAWLAEPRRADLLRRAAAAGATNPPGASQTPGEGGEAAASQSASGALSAVYEITEVINSMQDLDGMLSRLLDLGLGIVGAERGLIILRDEETGEQKVRAARQVEHETITDALAYSHSVVQEASEGRVIVALDARHDERFRNFRSVSLYAIKSLLCVPMRFRGKVIGTVYVDSRRAGVPFTEQDLRFMEAFANLAASALEQARLGERLASENVYLKREAHDRHSYQNLIGRNVKMQAVYDLMERVAASHLPVLIQGESGTGKELVARALHYASPRRQRKFLSENVAAIPDTLLESEMFGHVRGAFTGADRDRQGLFELADGGTLFLDEIGDMSLPMQAKVLRALQEGEVRPVGGKESRKVNVRIISASNKDLDKMLKEGRFREDLYFRLNVVRIPLPPLRDRKEDIPLLVDHFLARVSRESGAPPRRIEVGALQLLLRYSWPGNVRELENEIQRLAVLSQGEIITQRDIIGSGDLYDKITSLDQKDTFAPLEQMERQQIEKALVEAAGNRAKAAELLGISRATIFRKLRHYNISH